MQGEKFGKSSTGKDFDRYQENDENVEIFDINVELDGNDDDVLEMNFDENVEHEFNENLKDMLRDVENDFSDKNYHNFQNLFNESEKSLFPGCTKFTKQSAVLKLFNLKANNGRSDKSFTSLLELL